MNLTDDAIVGEARHFNGTEWVRFRVELATGDVEVDVPEGGRG